MSGVNVGIDLKDPFGHKADSRYQDQTKRDIYQQNADNQYRERAWLASERWNYKNFNAQQNRLTNLVADAKNAGISPLAALGQGGAAPISISMPSGQGGRVSGNYQRQGKAEIQANIDVMSSLQKQLLTEQVRGANLDNQGKQHDNNYKLWMLHEAHYPSNNPNVMQDFYQGYNTNYDEAQRDIARGETWVVNPDAGIQPNEFMGTYYHLKPYPEGTFNQAVKSW